MKLDNITLVCVEGTDREESNNNSIDALLVSSKNIEFGECVLISPKKPNKINSKINYKKIEPFDWIGYNRFIAHHLNDFVDTEYCILIQTDGFIINSHLWTDEFYKYDFIGHSFDFNRYPFQVNGVNPEVVRTKGINGLNRVGNGGFSLRSKKLLHLSQVMEPRCNGPEDAFICNDNYDYFVSNGVKFGSVEVANKFSKDYYDHMIGDTFGFHGNKNLLQMLVKT